METKKLFENTIKDYNKTMDEYLDWNVTKTSERKNPERLVSYGMLSESELTRSIPGSPGNGSVGASATLTHTYGACTWCKSMQDQCVWIYEAFDSVHHRPVCLKCGMKNLSNKDISVETKVNEKTTIDYSKFNSYVCKTRAPSDTNKKSNCSLCTKYKCEFTIIRSGNSIDSCEKCCQAFLMFNKK